MNEKTKKISLIILSIMLINIILDFTNIVTNNQVIVITAILMVIVNIVCLIKNRNIKKAILPYIVSSIIFIIIIVMQCLRAYFK